jgi:hypothetical protein
MVEAQQFAYSYGRNPVGEVGLRPELPFTLSINDQSVRVAGLVDSGGAINLLPYSIGVALGAVWEQYTDKVLLAGALGHSEARTLFATGTVSHFDPVLLVFAWSERDDVPLLLGQVNFFMEFDICFFRTRNIFEIRPKVTAE